jgi:hypothetical protein
VGEPGYLSRHSDSLDGRGWIAGRGERFFSTPQRPDQLCGPTSLLSNIYPRAPSSGIKRLEREADHLPPSSALVKNWWAVPPVPHRKGGPLSGCKPIKPLRRPVTSISCHRLTRGRSCTSLHSPIGRGFLYSSVNLSSHYAAQSPPSRAIGWQRQELYLPPLPHREGGPLPGCKSIKSLLRPVTSISCHRLTETGAVPPSTPPFGGGPLPGCKPIKSLRRPVTSISCHRLTETGAVPPSTPP